MADPSAPSAEERAKEFVRSLTRGNCAPLMQKMIYPSGVEEAERMVARLIREAKITALRDMEGWLEHGSDCKYEPPPSRGKFVCKCGLLDAIAALEKESNDGK